MANGAPEQDSASPIELYYWPTPNGWKITTMLEECGLAYAFRRDGFLPKGNAYQLLAHRARLAQLIDRLGQHLRGHTEMRHSPLHVDGVVRAMEERPGLG